ncbi:STAS domain-containing protein [Colwellia sp. RE-S-Sl-9]
MFTLPSQLTVAQVYTCQVDFLEFIDINDTITLNSDDVEKIDTLGIQFLLAAVTYILSQNKELIWECNSSVIQNTVKQLGLNEALLTQFTNV